VHSAGNVHFEKTGDSNTRMMQSIVKLAKELEVPIYYVSTAFLWREYGSTEGLRNTYEIDKFNSEKILTDSGVHHTIFRPSILTGNSTSGKLINWTGYYLLVGKFLEATRNSRGTKVRFPLLTGSSNMIPVDQAAEVISEAVIHNILNELIYVTNPQPPKAQWVLDTTLEFFGIEDRFEFKAINFADYETFERTREEDVLCLIGKHFSPYWSLDYNFPKSAVAENLITNEYLKKTLRSFQDLNTIMAI
jgi:thioester reductase-like protein